MRAVLPANLYRMVCAAGITIAIALFSLVAPVAHGATNEFATVVDLMNTSGLSGTVSTVNHDTPGDGGGMTFTIQTEAPDGVLGDIALPLADGKWAIPQGVASAPSTAVNEAAAQDAIARGQTFVDAGKSLIWDASRRSPISGGVVHQQMAAPYPITCSSFVGMTLLGWDYQHTTYVTQENSAVGYAVDFGVPHDQTDIWQAHRLAEWFYTHGDAWLGSEGGYQPGDVLFFSKQSPEGQGTTGKYFMNIYHVALYIGDGMVMHSTGPSAPGGVIVGRIGQTELNNLSLVVRPNWTGGQDIQPQQPGIGVAPNIEEAPAIEVAPSVAPETPTPVPSASTPQMPATQDSASPAAIATNPPRGNAAETRAQTLRNLVLPGIAIASIVLACGSAGLLFVARRRSGRAKASLTR